MDNIIIQDREYIKDIFDIEQENMFIDDIYSFHRLYESQSISTQLIPIVNDMYELLISCIPNIINTTGFIYTGYHWNFDKQQFIKLNNKKEPYSVWIKFYNDYTTKSHTYRNIENEKQGKTAICMGIGKKDNVKYKRVIFHELQHVRELYAVKDKNVVERNKTNVYGNKSIDDETQIIFKHILYVLSDAEQHAILHELYMYIQDKNTDTVNVLDNDILAASGIYEFEGAIKGIINLTGSDYDNVREYMNKQLFKLCIKLKDNFKFKHEKLTKSYIDNVLNDKEYVNTWIINSMIDFLWGKLKIYQRKVYRAIYKAIDDKFGTCHIIWNNQQ